MKKQTLLLQKNIKNNNSIQKIYFNKINLLFTSQKIQLLQLYKVLYNKNILSKKVILFNFFLYAHIYINKTKVKPNISFISTQNFYLHYASCHLSKAIINIIYLYYEGKLLL